MAAMDVIVEQLVKLWRIPAVRWFFPGLFLILSVLGSVLKELDFVPESYFSSSRNFINVYFVKFSWGWTLLLLTPFLVLCGYSAPALGKRLLSLAVATAVWYVCTGTFFWIEDFTGSCFESKASVLALSEFASKSACRRAGFHWRGHDISGHSFILTYASLLIMEETSPMNLRTSALSEASKTLLNLLYVALNLIVLTWVWMFACTSVYFHDPKDKFLGTVCGLMGWYLTYRFWYLKPFSPGLPWQPKVQKQHA
ncbi:fat storage-inducing transmembrane protein 2 [Cyprinodon tularosa]|uniref:fat storage-inducing transmembrane protein 2 n=1 Tax=Cyprinodon tularosa TaxID=77115 RepID=UPI0018E22CFE|nr:fat storage-inducing transmembrane protein 2 [Cyprinodon tularosa]